MPFVSTLLLGLELWPFIVLLTNWPGDLVTICNTLNDCCLLCTKTPKNMLLLVLEVRMKIWVMCKCAYKLGIPPFISYEHRTYEKYEYTFSVVSTNVCLRERELGRKIEIKNKNENTNTQLKKGSKLVFATTRV